MTDSCTWFAVYDTGDDADYEGFATKAEAVKYAADYLSFADEGDSAVFVVPVPDAWYADQTDHDDMHSLWDDLHKIPAEAFIWIRPSKVWNTHAREVGMRDVVDDLRSLADDQHDDLGGLLLEAANEIVRLRGELATPSKETR